MMLYERVLMSLNARIRGWQGQHFERTLWGKKIARLKGIHKGEMCVVVGNGPSLCAADLQKIHEKGIVTFATNRVYKIFDQTDWRPTYYVSEDANVLRGVQKEAGEVPCKAKFIPINLHWDENIEIADATYFYMDYEGKYEDTFGLSMDIPHAVRCRTTVTMTCLQLAVYMGFSKIYLIGVDHSYAKMIDKNGNEIIDNSIRSHFVDNYDSDIVGVGVNIDATTEAYLNAEQLSRKLKSFRVFNATRGGKLEVYERVNLDELFN